MKQSKESEDPINDEQTVIEFLEKPFEEPFIFDTAEIINRNYDPGISVTKRNITVNN